MPWPVTFTNTSRRATTKIPARVREVVELLTADLEPVKAGPRQNWPGVWESPKRLCPIWKTADGRSARKWRCNSARSSDQAPWFFWRGRAQAQATLGKGLVRSARSRAIHRVLLEIDEEVDENSPELKR
jgi:hypothetical protein